MWTKRLLIVTPVIMLLSIMTAGAGHGTPIPTALFYPILFCFSIFESGGGPLLWVVLLGQFPLYGLLIDWGYGKRTQLVIAGVVALLHIALVIFVINSQKL